MTTSAARLNANRRNAQKSTGPATEAGKRRVRLNARTHGLRAESDAVAPDEAQAVALRREQWAASFPGAEGHRGWIADQLVLASVRIDRCQAHRRQQAEHEADRAASCWEVDREAEAARLGARLAKEPDKVVAALRRSAAGVDWLLARWGGLADRLEAEGTWDEAQRRLCLDLLRSPVEFRDAELARLAALPAEARRALARAQVAHLETLRGPAESLDDAARRLAEVGLPTEEGPDLRRLRRYEDALWRRYRVLETAYEAAGARPPDADGLDVAPPPDARTTNPDPRAVAPPPGPTPPPGPPGPRPDRAALGAARNGPPADPAPIAARVDPAPASPVRSGPSSPTLARLAPTEPPVMLNRRARRALEKAKRGKRSR